MRVGAALRRAVQCEYRTVRWRCPVLNVYLLLVLLCRIHSVIAKLRELLRINTACYTKCHGFHTKRSFLFVLAKLRDLSRRYMSFATKCYGFMTCASFPFVLAKLRELSRKIHRICSAISRILHGCQVRKFINCVSLLKYMIHCRGNGMYGRVWHP